MSSPLTPELSSRQPGAMRTVRIEKLAPTGEGIARTPDGVGFVDRGLPGELVETSIYEARKRFWRGSLRAVLEPSPKRVDSPHASCAGCDLAHFEPAAALEAKRELFLETMQRIGKLEPALFGELAAEPSPSGYRLRARLQVSGAGAGTRVGYFAPGTHRVESAQSCHALSASVRELLARLEAGIADSRVPVTEVGFLEDIAGSRRLLRLTISGAGEGASALAARIGGLADGLRIESPEGHPLMEIGEPSLALEVGARTFRISVDSFFQGNRFLVSRLASDVEALARGAPAGEALDAFGGAGLFAGSLLSSGHQVTTVELGGATVHDARATREHWPERARWAIAATSVEGFLAADGRRFDVVVADPPRAGLGLALSEALARRARRLLVYVSCDPATLARDLPAILARGFQIRSAKLYDLFRFTHRVEALVALEPGA